MEFVTKFYVKTLNFTFNILTLCTTRFDIQKFHILPTQHVYMFCMVPRITNH